MSDSPDFPEVPADVLDGALERFCDAVRKAPNNHRTMLALALAENTDAVLAAGAFIGALHMMGMREAHRREQDPQYAAKPPRFTGIAVMSESGAKTGPDGRETLAPVMCIVPCEQVPGSAADDEQGSTPAQASLDSLETLRRKCQVDRARSMAKTQAKNQAKN